MKDKIGIAKEILKEKKYEIKKRMDKPKKSVYYRKEVRKIIMLDIAIGAMILLTVLVAIYMIMHIIRVIIC